MRSLAADRLSAGPISSSCSRRSESTCFRSHAENTTPDQAQLVQSQHLCGGSGAILMKRARLLLGGLILVAALGAPSAALAQASETAVKAAFLPRFARYITWPPASRPAAGQPFNLCVIGSDSFGSLLDNAAAGQTADGHRIVVRRLSSASAAVGCHVAFVQGSRTQPAGQVLAALSRKPVLTVTDSSSGQRGIIHFSIVNSRVRFFVDEAKAADRGLTSARVCWPSPSG